MKSPRKSFLRDPGPSGAVRVGYIPLLDAAPLIVAQEMGFFSKYGVQVKLSREAGWANIRDKIIFGDLEAAHSLAALPFVTGAGLDCVAYPTVAPFFFNLHGGAITLSNQLSERGVRDAASLKRLIDEDPGHSYTFGIVFPYSTHAFLLKKWLRSGGIDPEREIRIVVVPPPQMFASLRAGTLDGYCVGEPWNSLAVLNCAGWCPAVSASLDPSHPEKVLMCRSGFARQREAEQIALVAGLIEGALYCDHPHHREDLVRMLGQPEYLDLSPRYLLNALCGRFDCGHGKFFERDDFILFHRFNANEPTFDKGLRVLEQMRSCGSLVGGKPLPASMVEQVCQPQIFQQALHLTQIKNANPTQSTCPVS